MPDENLSRYQCLQSPFDAQIQVKIFLETQANISIFRLISLRKVELISSAVLEVENKRNLSPMRQKFVEAYLGQASQYQILTDEIGDRAKQLTSIGLKNFDALHVASAEAARCDYLLTCDKRLIARCKEIALKVVNPVDFILEIADADPEQ